MAKRGERICVTCGKKYEYCPNCGKGNIKDAWKYMHDTEECRDVFKTCSAFAFKHINAEQAQRKLAKYDLTDTSRFTEDIRMNLADIFAVPETKVEEPVVEKVDEGFIQPASEDKQDEEKPEMKDFNFKKHHNKFVKN